MSHKNDQFTSDLDDIIDGLNLYDDILMEKVFDNNIEAAEVFLSIVLEQPVKVISVICQKQMKNHEVSKRSIILDVYAVGKDGQIMNVEVQGNTSGAHVRRSRFHSSMIDSRMLLEGQNFRELKDSYVIFMCKHDKYKKGLPLYHIDRYVGETQELFGDGSHIIYVNGKYKGDTPIGQLISDFHQNDSGKIHYKPLAKGVRYYKEEEEGREIMGDAIERFAKGYAKSYAKQIAKEVTEQVTQQVTEQVTQQVTEQVTQQVTEQVTQQVTEQVTQQVTENVTLETNVNSVKNLMEGMNLTAEEAMNILKIEDKLREKVLKVI